LWFTGELDFHNSAGENDCRPLCQRLESDIGFGPLGNGIISRKEASCSKNQSQKQAHSDWKCRNQESRTLTAEEPYTTPAAQGKVELRNAPACNAL
jgi:hypothetical protein